MASHTTLLCALRPSGGILRRRLAAAILGAALALLALQAPARAADKLSLRLDWITHPIHMAFFLAQQRGWFAKAGLDVHIEDGNGSTTTVQIVGGGGNFDLGHADLSPMAVARARGFPVVSIAGFIRKGAVGFVVPVAFKVTSLKDFVGRELLYTAGSIEGPFIEPLFRAHGISKDQLRLTNVDAASKISAYLAGRADAMITTAPPQIVIAKGRRDSYAVLFADYGLSLPGFGLFARTDTLKEKGAAIKRFVSVVCAAWPYILASPAHEVEAAKATRAERPNTPLSVAMLGAQLESYRGNFFTAATEKTPICIQSATDWAAAIKSLEAAKLIRPGTTPSDYFTNDYIDLAYGKSIVGD